MSVVAQDRRAVPPARPAPARPAPARPAPPRPSPVKQPALHMFGQDNAWLSYGYDNLSLPLRLSLSPSVGEAQATLGLDLEVPEAELPLLPLPAHPELPALPRAGMLAPSRTILPELRGPAEPRTVPAPVLPPRYDPFLLLEDEPLGELAGRF